MYNQIAEVKNKLKSGKLKIKRKCQNEHMYGWVPLLFTWNCHNIVNRPYSKIKSVCVCVFKSALHTPPIPVAIPDGSVVRNLPANAGDVGSIPGWERSLGERNGNPLQYSCLGDPMDRGSWEAAVHGVTKESDRTQWLNSNNRHTFLLMFCFCVYLYMFCFYTSIFKEYNDKVISLLWNVYWKLLKILFHEYYL